MIQNSLVGEVFEKQNSTSSLQLDLSISLSESSETSDSEKKILNKSKGSLKLLNYGELKDAINIEISSASKKAIEKIEKLGGKIITAKE